MALIKCPECGKEVSDRAPACPNCGTLLKMKLKNTNTNCIIQFLEKAIPILWRNFSPEVLGYTEEETQWFIDKGGLMNIACDLTLE